MKPLIAAVIALAATIGLAPATAQTSQRTTVVERPNGTTVVRQTTTRRVSTTRTGYDRPRRVRTCKVKFRNGKRVRTCTYRYR